MKKVLFLMFAAAAVPLALQAETWKNASLMDSMCASKAEVKADPDAHTTKCAIQFCPVAIALSARHLIVELDTP